MTKARACGTCNACCKALHIIELNKPAGIACQHLSPTKGCGSYNDRPSVCHEYECLWLRGSVPSQHRPDRAGVIFEVGPEALDPTFDILVATEVWEGASHSLDMAAIIKQHAKNRVVIVQTPSGTRLYGPSDRVAAMQTKLLTKPLVKTQPQEP